MKKIGISCKRIEKMIEEFYIGKKSVLNILDVFKIVENLRVVIEMNEELNYLEDIKTDILSLKNNKEENNNLIIKKDILGEHRLKELTVEVINMLDEQGLLLVLEPNNNLYMDIDYAKLISLLKNYASIEFMSILLILDNIERQAIVDYRGNLREESFKELYDDIFVSTDFEKNPVKFNYMCGILNELNNVKQAINEK